MKYESETPRGMLLMLFTEDEVELIFTALQAKESYHEARSKSIRNSGYGKATTFEKADTHQRSAETVHALMNKLTDYWI